MNLQEIKADINTNGETADALYLATESQITKLVDRGDIDSDYEYHASICREEMRVMISTL